MDTYQIEPINLEFNTFTGIANETQRDYLIGILVMNLSLLTERNKGMAVYLVRSLCICLDPYDTYDAAWIDKIKLELKRLGIQCYNF
jgi:hypothetical protein